MLWKRCRAALGLCHPEVYQHGARKGVKEQSDPHVPSWRTAEDEEDALHPPPDFEQYQQRPHPAETHGETASAVPKVSAASLGCLNADAQEQRADSNVQPETGRGLTRHPCESSDRCFKAVQ